jgi:hypothetical protein
MSVKAGSDVPQLKLTIKQGADQTVSWIWKKSDGTPIDLTGFSMLLTIRSAIGGAPLLTLSSASTTKSRIALGGATGGIDWIFDKADTALLPATGLPAGNPYSGGIPTLKLGFFDCQATNPSGDVGYIVEGPVTLDPKVT